MKKGEKDRLSDLPDFLLLHILKFMNTKNAVQTCVLSKIWKNLWKCLTNLALNSSDFNSLPNFSKFVSFILLTDLDLKRKGCIETELLDYVMTYAVSHNVQRLSIDVNLNFEHGFKLHPCVFYCKSLTYLKLSIWAIPWMTELPTSLHLPALKNLHLEHVTFAANGNGCAEPFSNCHSLNTLVLDRCNLHRDAKFLCILNSKLSCLTIGSTIQEVAYKVELSVVVLAIFQKFLHEF